MVSVWVGPISWVFGELRHGGVFRLRSEGTLLAEAERFAEVGEVKQVVGSTWAGLDWVDLGLGSFWWLDFPRYFFFFFFGGGGFGVRIVFWQDWMWFFKVFFLRFWNFMSISRFVHFDFIHQPFSSPTQTHVRRGFTTLGGSLAVHWRSLWESSHFGTDGTSVAHPGTILWCHQDLDQNPRKLRCFRWDFHPFEKENHQNQTSIFGFKILVFRWCRWISPQCEASEPLPLLMRPGRQSKLFNAGGCLT